MIRPLNVDPPGLTEEQKEARRAEHLARCERAGTRAREHLAWMLDFYGYRDDQPITQEHREGFQTLFDSYAAQDKACVPLIVVLSEYSHKELPTAGELREVL